MSILLFEDEAVSQLDPVALGRPAFSIGCGSARLIELVSELEVEVRAYVRPHLREIVRQDYPQIRLADSDWRDCQLAINARLVPSRAALDQLKTLLAASRSGVVCSGESIAACVLSTEQQAAATPGNATTPSQWLAGLAAEPLTADLPLFDYPHDIIRHHASLLSASLEHRIASSEYQEIAAGLFVAAGASVGDYLVSDTRRGPIVVESGATIGPHCYLSGPVHIGRDARVLEHAALKDGVALGHTTKIGGEIECSVVEPYTNKQHHGFLGHTYLGSWINLGAGTCNSDLKNTYGQVNMEYRGRKVPTGMQFVGAIVGDYAKTAINTGIFTGKTIGVCSMVYGFVTTNVPSFVNYARLFGQVTEAPVEVMASTQARMFARRGVTQRPCDIQLLRDMYELTIHERGKFGEPLSLEPLSL